MKMIQLTPRHRGGFMYVNPSQIQSILPHEGQDSEVVLAGNESGGPHTAYWIVQEPPLEISELFADAMVGNAYVKVEGGP